MWHGIHDFDDVMLLIICPLLTIIGFYFINKHRSK